MVPRGERSSNAPDLLDNLQVWYENDYNSRLLHKSISFPLLKRLSLIGDPTAKRIFKEEIAKRFVSNHFQTMEFLINEGYLDLLSAEELNIVLDNSNISRQKFINIVRYIDSYKLTMLNKIELLIYAKKYKIKINKVGKEIVYEFFRFIDKLNKLNELSFILKNKSILVNIIVPFIDKIRKGPEEIKKFFLRDINLRLNRPQILDIEGLTKIKEIFYVGFKNQTVLDQF